MLATKIGKKGFFQGFVFIKESEIGNAYGILGVIDNSKDKYYNKSTSYFTQLSYKDEINRENKVSLLAGYNRYYQEAEASHPKVPTIDAIYKEESYFYEIDFISTALKDNKLLIGAKYESAKTIESSWSAGKPYISDPSLTRRITSIYLNNNYSVSSELDLSTGIRYDHYSDFGDAYSPNLGLVYRLNEKTRFKALYSHAFRAPSWVELTSNSNLEAEKSNSIEGGVIFKQNQQNVIRLNFYATKLKDMITKDSTGIYTQNLKNNFLGSEVEYIYSPNNQTELNFFASYIDAEDEDGNDLADVANILASTSLTYELNSGFTFGSLLKYISSSKRSNTDLREEMPYSLIFDQTISYTYKDFTSTFVLKDLFDAGTYYALPQNNYGNDFYDEGRTFLLNVALEF